MGDKMADEFERNNQPSWDINRQCLEPLVEVRETEEEVVVTADLPCVNKENIEITVEEKNLTINAEMKNEMQFESWGGVHRKIKFNSFRKNVTLPSKVNPDKSEAKFRKGLLEVRLKKKTGKKIDIK